jgi:secondary thiamine-phosphate synthase enzyme
VAVEKYSIEVEADGFADVIDITSEVQGAVSKGKVQTGLACVFVAGSTGAVTTIEHEPGLVQDLKEAFERVASESAKYQHDLRWGDGNGFSHVRAALVGPSVTVPVERGKLQLGTWQQIVFIDFDNRPRSRRLSVTVVGE